MTLRAQFSTRALCHYRGHYVRHTCARTHSITPVIHVHRHTASHPSYMCTDTQHHTRHTCAQTHTLSCTLRKSLVAMLTYCIVDSSPCGARAGANRRGHHALHVHGDGVVGEGARQQVVRFAVERKRPECKDHLLDCQVVRVRSTPTMLP
jgi:hypothetical protein